MKIPENLEYEHHVKVTEEYVAKGIGLDVKIFSTPSLVLCMEIAAYKAMEKYIPEDYTTVGTGICIKHLKATPIGDTVRCRARLIKQDGKKLEFEVSAFDSQGKVGEGKHYRYIVNKKEFEERIAGSKV